jgi:phytoene dehydrogenase-like protein
MKFDVIIIGAGFGGLSCAAKLAKSGRKVLLLEKKATIGGTSYIFKRGPYTFPMGPLGFSHPGRILSFLEEVGVKDKPSFTRNHFQLASPDTDLIFSLPLQEFKQKLVERYKKEKYLDDYFTELEDIIALIKNIPSWHPEYLLGKQREDALAKIDDDMRRKMKRMEHLSSTPCSDLLNRFIQDQSLRNLLGTMGTRPPRMSLLNLAIMWQLMSAEGIWSPSYGIHGLIDRLAEAYSSYGGILKTGCPVEEITIKNGEAVGVRARGEESYEAGWIVSNPDYKKTFLEMIPSQNLPAGFKKNLERASYTGSELCVFLGVDPEKIDWREMKARHLFYSPSPDDLNLTEKAAKTVPEIEVCLWSDSGAKTAPPGRKALVLRSGLSFTEFEKFWQGEKKRKPGYGELKGRLADSLMKTTEMILPGLSSAIEIREAATPLTYQDWGQRYRGSIAGWSWSPRERKMERKLLIETPIHNLLMVGIYSASELFLGGVPTAVHTGSLAANRICE